MAHGEEAAASSFAADKAPGALLLGKLPYAGWIKSRARFKGGFRAGNAGYTVVTSPVLVPCPLAVPFLPAFLNHGNSFTAAPRDTPIN